MVNKNKLSEYAVIIGDGSGCLFQSSDEKFTYVLTAKHVIDIKRDVKVIRQFLRNETIIIEEYDIIGEPFFHPDQNKDAAILRIKKIENLDDLLRDEDMLDGSAQYYLAGHPDARKGKDYSFRVDELKLSNTQNFGYIEAELNKSSPYSEIVGFSGGGILRIEYGCILLAGIQKRMSVADEQEQLGRIEFMPLSFFDEIVHKNMEELLPIFPSYISSFTRLVDYIFPLRNLQLKKDLIQAELKSIAKELCLEFNPKEILKLYGDSFLIYDQDKSLKNTKLFWQSFLEVLVMNRLFKGAKLSLKELVEIHKRRKFLFGAANEWTELTQEIFQSDLSDIEKGGTILINVIGDTHPSLLELSNEIVCDICTVPSSQMLINNTISNPFSDLTIVHIYKFQHHIITNINKFRQANSFDILNLIEDETRQIF